MSSFVGGILGKGFDEVEGTSEGLHAGFGVAS